MDTSAHIYEGGTGITNFTRKQILAYVITIEEMNHPTLFIGKAMPPCTDWPDDFALRSRTGTFPENISEFWDLFDKNKKILEEKGMFSY